MTIFVCCNFLLQTAAGQSKTGLTGIPDTSFSIRNEYKKLVKTYPGINIAGEMQPAGVIEKQNIEFRKTVTRKLFLDVFLPEQKTSSKRAAIIILFGGGWRSGNRTLHHPLARRLAQLGYVCFTPDYRLSTEALYPAAIYDVKAVIRWVRKNAKKYNINEDAIVVTGHSAGGELAAFMGSTNGIPEFEGSGANKKINSSVNAVIDIDGTLAFIHPESGEGDDSKKISAATNWFGYSKTENPTLWKQAAPLTHVGAHSCPILFLNSSVARMHAGREDYIKILDQYHIYSEVRTFEGAPHSFCFFDPWFEPMVKYMDDFLKMVFKK